MSLPVPITALITEKDLLFLNILTAAGQYEYFGEIPEEIIEARLNCAWQKVIGKTPEGDIEVINMLEKAMLTAANEIKK